MDREFFCRIVATDWIFATISSMADDDSRTEADWFSIKALSLSVLFLISFMVA